jgi:hypothetical protein
MSVVAFIESPLQAMNLYEYCSRRKIGVDLLVVNVQSSLSSKNRAQIYKVLQLMGPPKKLIEFDESFSLRNVFRLLSSLRSVSKYIVNDDGVHLISGEYRSVFFWSLVKRISKRVSKVAILDDGSATLRINRFREKRGICKAVFELLFGIRSSAFGNITFFSVYKLGDHILPQDELVRNTYVSLRGVLSRYQDCSDTVYIIGAPLYEAGVVVSFDKDVQITLNMVRYFKGCYPSCQFKYIPHRREALKKLDLLSVEIDIERCDFPFEIYSFAVGRGVSCVAGFYSSLFDNLAEIYKDKITILSCPLIDAVISEDWKDFVSSIYRNYQLHRPEIKVLSRDVAMSLQSD